MITKVAILGGGHMGSDLFGFLGKTREATLWVRRQEAADELEAKHLGPLRRRAAKSGKRAEAAKAQLARLTVTTDLSAIADADLVIETVVEDVEVKRGLLEKIGGIVRPEAIVTSNSSFTVPSALADALPHPERFAGFHWFFPAKFVPFVEIIPHGGTEQRVVDALVELCEELGKRPLYVGREVVAHLVNRVLGPWYTESLHVLGEGYHTASAIDAEVTAKLSMMGPIEGADQIGLDVMYNGEVRFPHEKRPGDHTPAILRWLNEQGRFGSKVGKGCYNYVEGKPVDSAKLPKLFTEHGDPGAYPIEDVPERLFHSALLESYRVLTMGVGTREDIDWCLKHILALAEGPFEYTDRVGKDVVKARLVELHQRYGERFDHRGLLDS